MFQAGLSSDANVGKGMKPFRRTPDSDQDIAGNIHVNFSQ